MLVAAWCVRTQRETRSDPCADREVEGREITHRALLVAVWCVRTQRDPLGTRAQTGMYTKTYWLHRLPIVCTVDRQADFNVQNGWIKENAVVLDLGDDPAYCAE